MWRQFHIPFFCTTLAGLGGAFLFVLLVDPLGVSPVAVFSDQNIVYNNRRQAMPQIIRSGRYDSFIVGTSTTIYLDPKWAETAFGGRFANVAIHGATLYEQSRVIGLIARQKPKIVIHGLDAGWCQKSALSRYHPWWPFPEWLYDDIHVYDLGRLLNWYFFRLAVSKVRLAFGLDLPAVLANGFETQLPKDSTWDLAKARNRIYRFDAQAASGSSAAEPRMPPVAAAPISASSFPGIDLLRETIAMFPESTQLVILFMPVHFSLLPLPGTEQYTALETCKQLVADLVRRPNAHVIDFMRRSPISNNDSHFWDGMHVREAVATDLVMRIREAIKRRESADDDTYRYLFASTTEPDPAALTTTTNSKSISY